MNCACHDEHPLVMFGKLLGDNCVGLTGWGFVAMFGTIIVLVLTIVPAIDWLSRR